jgi:hypothetical protein
MNLLSDHENDNGCASRDHPDAGDGICNCGLMVYDIDLAMQAGTEAAADSGPSGVSV